MDPTEISETTTTVPIDKPLRANTNYEVTMKAYPKDYIRSAPYQISEQFTTDKKLAPVVDMTTVSYTQTPEDYSTGKIKFSYADEFAYGRNVEAIEIREKDNKSFEKEINKDFDGKDEEILVSGLKPNEEYEFEIKLIHDEDTALNSGVPYTTFTVPVINTPQQDLSVGIGDFGTNSVEVFISENGNKPVDYSHIERVDVTVEGRRTTADEEIFDNRTLTFTGSELQNMVITDMYEDMTYTITATAYQKHYSGYVPTYSKATKTDTTDTTKNKIDVSGISKYESNGVMHINYAFKNTIGISAITDRKIEYIVTNTVTGETQTY